LNASALIGGEALELPLHRVDLSEIGCNVVVTAALAGGQGKTAAREDPGRACATEMNDGGEFLPLLRGGGGSPVCDNLGDVAV